jgi:hypothetical protein
MHFTVAVSTQYEQTTILESNVVANEDAAARE